MTREEAVKRIKEFGLYHAIKDLPYSARTAEAFEMAIRSLEAWDDVTAEFAIAVPWCIDTEEDRAYMEGLSTGYHIVQKHLERVENERTD